VGQVRGLHGLRGTVRLEVLTDRPEDRFRPGLVLHREGNPAPLTIAEAAPVSDGPGWRVRFSEIRDRASAERLRDAYLEAEVDRAADLEPGAAYWHEVIGTEVRGRDGRVLGTVADVYRIATAEVLVVRGGPVGEFDLPVVRDIVVEFSPQQGSIVVDEGVLDLDSAPVDALRARPPRRRPRWSRHGKGGVESASGPAPAADAPPLGGDGAPAGADPPD